jgi:hypothetical protein
MCVKYLTSWLFISCEVEHERDFGCYGFGECEFMGTFGELGMTTRAISYHQQLGSDFESNNQRYRCGVCEDTKLSTPCASVE